MNSISPGCRRRIAKPRWQYVLLPSRALSRSADGDAPQLPSARSAWLYCVFYRSVRGGKVHHRACVEHAPDGNGQALGHLAGWRYRAPPLSSELGFSREHRNINVRRIGYVASEITKNRGSPFARRSPLIAIRAAMCAPWSNPSGVSSKSSLPHPSKLANCAIARGYMPKLEQD